MLSETTEIRSIILNNKEYTYTLTRKNVKNINIRIKLSGEILVSVNKNVQIKVVEEALQSKSEFIIRDVAKFEEMRKNLPAPKQYVDGEVYYLLGKKLQIKIKESMYEGVLCDGTYLYIDVNDINDINKKMKLVEKHLNNTCNMIIPNLLNEIYKSIKMHKIKYPTIKFRKMTSRLGSCIPAKNQVIFNKKLIQYPVECIEYVILHELIHFVHPNHSKDFYDTVSIYMPDWKTRKEIIDKFSLYIK